MINTNPVDQHQVSDKAPGRPDFRVERDLRKRLAVMLSLVTFATLAVTLTTIYVLYRAAIFEQRNLLAEMTRSQALVINAVAEFDHRESNDVPGGSFEATLSQVRSAFQNLRMSDKGKELLLGRIRGDRIEYLLRQDNGRSDSRRQIPLESQVGEPMRRALSGTSGTMTGIDYDGNRVLAAYEPIPKLGAGLVAKIALTEVRRPFIHAAGIALGCTLVLTLGCVLSLHRVGIPIVRAVEELYARFARTNQALRVKIQEHERTEKALRASESRFRGFLDSLGDAAFMLDLKGNLVYVNASAAHMVHRDVAQIIGQSFVPFVASHSTERALQAYQQVLFGQAADYEATLEPGTVVHVRMEPHYDLDRRIVGAVGIARDVSERRELVNALRESEQRYSLLLSNLPGMVYRCRNDRSWTMLFVSKGAKALTGYEPDDLLANRRAAYGDLIHPDDRDDVWNEIQMASEQHGSFELTYRILAADGTEKRVWERGRVVETAPGEGVQLEGFITDISKRDMTERALRESEARFRAMADCSPVGVYLSDAAGNNVYVNKTICGFTGLTPEQHAGQAWKEVIHPDDREFMIDIWKRAIENGEPFDAEFRFQSTDGRVTWVLSRSVPIRDDAGGFTGFIGTTTDVTAQKRAEALLRESEHFIRSAMNALSSHLAVIDGTGRIVAVNDAWRHFAAQNFSSDEIVGEGANYLDVCDNAQGDEAQEAQSVARGIREVLAGTTQLFEHEYTCHSPTEQRWFVVRVTRFLNNNSPRAVIAHENITERKRAQHALLEQKQLLTLVLSSIPHNVFWKDTNCVYLGCNDQFARAAGLSTNEEIVGKTDYDLAWTREESDWYRKCDLEVMKSGKPLLDIEESQQDASGRDLTILTSKVPLRKASEEVTGVLGIFIDITDRKHTEQRLRLQSAALAAAANAIVITDRSGVIVWTNPAFTELTGYTAEEALGASPRLLKSDTHPPEFYRQMWKTVLSGNVWQGELINRRKNGEHYTEEMTITPVRSSDHAITHFVAIKHDISERKQHEEERLRLATIERETEALIQAKQAADAASRAKSEFLANMSHELRTPLNGVITLNELLLKTDLQPTQRRFALLARQSGETLLALISDILDFSKIEAGRLDLEEIEFNLYDVVEQVAGATAAVAEAKRLELICSLHPAVPSYLRGDPTRLKQVLTNLLNNAVKFTDEGEVLLRVTVDSDSEDRARLRFSISDTGIGIAAESQRLLFEKFSQADTSTTRKYGGTGLGLAICKQLVDRMGGEIGVVSSPEAGSTFWFSVEFIKQPHASQHRPKAPASLRDLRLLVVDDNEINREIVQEQLGCFGLAAHAVSDGAAALEALRTAMADASPFDLAIVDFHMPGMDGEELARVIKADPIVADTVLVLLSSSGEYNPERFRAAGFAGWITKPVGSSELLGAIVEAYACARSPRTLPGSEGQFGPPEVDQQPTTAATGHVLLVEDNEIGKEAAQELLRQAGYSCDTAENGKRAVEAVLSRPYDLVLMDCQMPEMDGFEATEMIRKLEIDGKIHGPSGRRLPIVALTANALSGDRDKCLAAGMDDYLTKPLNPDRLVKLIKQHLSGKSKLQEEKPMPANQPPADAESAIDFAALAQRWTDNPAFAERLLNRFCDEIPALVKQLANELANSNLDEAARVAHTIKGAAGYVEAPGVRNPAADLEQLCRSGSTDHADQILETLKSEMQRCQDTIRQRQSNHPQTP